MRYSAAREDEDREPEITLSTPSLLGLFLGLVLICGVFFGFGYSVGRHTTAMTATAVNTANSGDASNDATAQAPSTPRAQDAGDDASSPTPSDQTAPLDASAQAPSTPQTRDAGDGASSPAPSDQTAPLGASSQATQPGPVGLPTIETPAPPRPNFASTAPAQKSALTPDTAETTLQRNPRTTATVQRTGAVIGTGLAAGPAMVQVAAVAHQEDADVLVSALRQRGYGVVVRSEPQDKLLHVQIGPFASRDQANTMRQKLLSDGYDAIIKH